MPLFFWISGYLYHKPTNILIYAARKVRTLLIPYFIVGLAYSFLDWFRAGIALIVRKNILREVFAL